MFFKLKLIFCCKTIIKCEIKINIFSLLYMKERRIKRRIRRGRGIKRQE